MEPNIMYGKIEEGAKQIPVCDLKPGQGSTFVVSQVNNRPVNCIQLKHWPSSHDEIIIKIQQLYKKADALDKF
jgi:hypothetical protein